MPAAPSTDRRALNRVLRDLGVLGDQSDDEIAWMLLGGGYHNDVSLVSTTTGEVVVKHFIAGSTDPLYPQLSPPTSSGHCRR